MWNALVRAYRTDEKFAHYVAGWIVDLRFETKPYVYDDILALEPSNATRLDMILLANEKPTWSDVVSAVVSHPLAIDRISTYLADGGADVGEIVSLARSCGSISIVHGPFQGLPIVQQSNMLAKAHNLRRSYVANPAFIHPIETLIASACEVLNITYTRGRSETYVLSGQTSERVPHRTECDSASRRSRARYSRRRSRLDPPCAR